MRVFGVAGWKNSGKTGLMTRLISHFTKAGLTVASLKHAHHDFDLDQPGKDSDRHRKAGAGQVLIASERRWALLTEASPPGLPELLSQLAPNDLVLVEGWKREPIPKIECHREESANAELLALSDPNVRAVASDGHPDVPCPVLQLDDTEAIAAFIASEVGI